MPINIEKQNRTRQRIIDALIELCNEVGYYNTTITKLCERAGLDKSTFYRYYTDKDDLLRDMEEQYVEHTRSLTVSFLNYDPNHFAECRALYLDDLTEDMQYHYSHRGIFLFLMSPNGDPKFRKRMFESLVSRIDPSLIKIGVNFGNMQPYFVNFIANGFISTLYDWLRNDNCSPREIASFLLMMRLDLPSAIKKYKLSPHLPQ